MYQATATLYLKQLLYLGKPDLPLHHLSKPDLQLLHVGKVNAKVSFIFLIFPSNIIFFKAYNIPCFSHSCISITIWCPFSKSRISY